MKYSQTIRYKNELEADLRVTVEPWARQYLIEPQVEVRIVLSSDEPIGEVEVWSSSTGINSRRTFDYVVERPAQW